MEADNWRPILRFALPYVCYMFRSGPFRDAHVVHGLDPRKDKKWAPYQTLIFNFRRLKPEVTEVKEEDEEEGQRESHVFTGKEVNTPVVCYCLCDIVDPILRKIIEESPLRDQFHVTMAVVFD